MLTNPPRRRNHRFPLDKFGLPLPSSPSWWCCPSRAGALPSLSFSPPHHLLLSSSDRYGEIGDIYIPRDHRSGDSRGFAFVRFRSREDAESAMNKEDGRVSPQGETEGGNAHMQCLEWRCEIKQGIWSADDRFGRVEGNCLPSPSPLFESNHIHYLHRFITIVFPLLTGIPGVPWS